MQHKLDEFLARGPRQWLVFAKRDLAFMAWVYAQTTDMEVDTPLKLRVYCAARNERPRCPYGKDRKLPNITVGWTGCGPTAQCRCALETVRRKIKAHLTGSYD